MGLSMTDIAHTWYASLHHEILIDYNAFIAAFRSFFVHINVHQHIADFHKRVQSPTETVTAFYLALKKCVQRSGNLLKKSDHKHQFEEGLQPTLKRFVLEKEPKSLATSSQEARKQEALLLRLKISNPAINTILQLPNAAFINPPPPPTTNNVERQLQQMQHKIQQMQDKINSQQKQIQQYQNQQTQKPKYNNNRSPYPNNQRNRPLHKPFCNFCRGVGHRTIECRKRKMYVSGQIQTVRCRTCQGMGHYSHMCHLSNPRQVPESWLREGQFNYSQQTNYSPPPTTKQTTYQSNYPPQKFPKQQWNASLFGNYTPTAPTTQNYPLPTVMPFSTQPSPIIRQLPLPKELPPHVNVLSAQEQQQYPLPTVMPFTTQPTLTTTQLPLLQQQQLQQQVQQQQQTLQQQQQVLQSLAQLQLNTSSPPTQINATTSLFEDSDINQSS